MVLVCALCLLCPYDWFRFACIIVIRTARRRVNNVMVVVAVNIVGHSPVVVAFM